MFTAPDTVEQFLAQGDGSYSRSGWQEQIVNATQLFEDVCKYTWSMVFNPGASSVAEKNVGQQFWTMMLHTEVPASPPTLVQQLIEKGLSRTRPKRKPRQE